MMSKSSRKKLKNEIKKDASISGEYMWKDNNLYIYACERRNANLELNKRRPHLAINSVVIHILHHYTRSNVNLKIVVKTMIRSCISIKIEQTNEKTSRSLG